jgi:hypothetical protein
MKVFRSAVPVYIVPYVSAPATRRVLLAHFCGLILTPFINVPSVTTEVRGKCLDQSLLFHFGIRNKFILHYELVEK